LSIKDRKYIGWRRLPNRGPLVSLLNKRKTAYRYCRKEKNIRLANKKNKARRQCASVFLLQLVFQHPFSISSLNLFLSFLFYSPTRYRHQPERKF